MLEPAVPFLPETRSPVVRRRGLSYGLAALAGEIDALRAAPEGARNDRLNVAAFRLGQLVGGGELDVGDVFEALWATAGAIGLGDKEAVGTIASGLSKGMTNPRRRYR